MKFAITFSILLALAAAAEADILRVDLNPPERRTDILSPHWENWAWHEGASGSNVFGAITVTFRAGTKELLLPVLFKGTLDYEAHMASDGFVVKNSGGDGGVDMIITGLAPGKHTITTYHNEVRDRTSPAKVDVLI